MTGKTLFNLKDEQQTEDTSTMCKLERLALLERKLRIVSTVRQMLADQIRQITEEIIHQKGIES